MVSFEFFQTSFSYIDKDSGEEHFVGVPEEGGRNVISGDPFHKNELKVVPMGVSGSKQESPERIHVDYNALANAIKNSDLNSRQEA